MSAAAPVSASQGAQPPAAGHARRTERRLVALRRDLWREARRMRRQWRFRISRGRVEFADDVHDLHVRLRQSLPAYLIGAKPSSLLAVPIIYSLVAPFLLLDVWVTVYQWLCFPLFGVARVRRRDYFRLDRHKLRYLNAIERANCTYCTYANGVVAYVREVAARTEQYWCPIKHARPVPAPHARYHQFFDYGDAAAYRRDLERMRRRLRPDRLR